MVAISRRVFGVFLVLVALVLLFWPGAGIWQLQLADYGAEYRERVEYAKKMAAKRAKEGGKPLVVQAPDLGGLDQYVKKETRGSLRKVEGPAWEELFEKTSRVKRYYYLPAETPPLNALDRADGRDFFDLQLPDKYPVFLTANLVSSSSSSLGPEVTWGMKHPLAWLALWLGLIGLVVYIFLPRPKTLPGHFRYHRVRSQTGPDLIGVFLAGIFLVLPLLILTQLSQSAHPLNVLTLICWFLALLCAALFFISTWYEGLYFRITPTGVSKVNLFGTQEFSFDQMIGMDTTVWKPPAWFRRLSWIMTIFSLGLAAPMILGSMNRAPMVKVRCKDGRVLSIMTKHLTGWKELEQALIDSGLEYVDEEQEPS